MCFLECVPFWSCFEDERPLHEIIDHSFDETPLGRSSTILKGKQAFIKQLQEWVPQNKWRCVYRASRDGWKGRDFHKKCGQIKPTVTLIKVSDYLFGGYTDQDWASSNQCK